MPRAGTRPSQPRLDDLTGLRNTRALREELDERTKAGAAGVPLAIVVVDFDRLGALNLRYDRSVGDAVLWGGASVARDEAPSPRLVFRYDDDDLVLLVPGDEEDGREVAERIRERIAARNRDLPAVTVSCGVAAAETAAHAWRALENAGAALRTAKRAGGNRVVMGTHRNGNGNGSSGMDTALRAALALAVTTLEVRNPETADHSDDVVTIAETIGRRFGLANYELDRLAAGAQLHDVGKLAIPTEILNKPGPLDKDEWAVIKEHTVIGERILRSVPEMAEVATIVRHSHEHWDGSGYPDGLAGEEIPLASRIILAADAFHAMRSDRSYRRGRSADDAIAELLACSGSQFDPRVVDAIVEIARDVRTDRTVTKAGLRRIRRLVALLAAFAVAGGSAYAASEDVRHVVDGVVDVVVPGFAIAESNSSHMDEGASLTPADTVSRIVPVDFSEAVDRVRSATAAPAGDQSSSAKSPADDASPEGRGDGDVRATVPGPQADDFEPLVPIAISIDVQLEEVATPAAPEVAAAPAELTPLVEIAPTETPTPNLTPAAELAPAPKGGAFDTPPATGNPHGEPPGLVELPDLDEEKPAPPAVGNPHGEAPARGNPHGEPPALGTIRDALPSLEDLPVLDDPPALGNPHDELPALGNPYGEPPALGNPHGDPPGLVRLPELDPPPTLEQLPELANDGGEPPAVGNPHGEPPGLEKKLEETPGLSVVEGTPILGDLSSDAPAVGNPHGEAPAVGNPHEETPPTGDADGAPPAVGNPHGEPPAVGNPHGEPPAVGNPHVVDPEPVAEPVVEPVAEPELSTAEAVVPAVEPIFGPGMELFTPAVTAPGKSRGRPWREAAIVPPVEAPPADPAP